MIFALVTAIAYSGLILIAVVQSQGGTGNPFSTDKTAFEATQKAIRATDEAGPRAPKSTPASLSFTCPNLTIKLGIFDNRGDGPPNYRRFVNQASVVKDDMHYVIWAGSPYDAPQLGLLRVEQDPVDPCASRAAGKTTPQPKEFLILNGPLKIIQVDQEVVTYNRKDATTGQLNFVSGTFLQPEVVPTATPMPATATPLSVVTSVPAPRLTAPAPTQTRGPYP